MIFRRSPMLILTSACLGSGIVYAYSVWHDGSSLAAKIIALLWLCLALAAMAMLVRR